MGLFWTSKKYSQEQKSLGSDELQKIIRNGLAHVQNISDDDRAIVERTLLATKGTDGKISLEQIYEALHHLRNQHTISPADERTFMELFKEHLGS